MGLSVGIVGLPNAGKSTLFNALLKKQVAYVASYPFATIEPNVGVVPVPDPRLSKIAEIVSDELSVVGQEKKKIPLVPATVKFIDIAGLVAGAHKGEGLGNKFLAHIREVDLICHMIRYFGDPSVVHMAAEVDPARDKGIVEAELMLADLETLEKQTEPRMNATKEELKKWEIISRFKVALNQGQCASRVITDPQEQDIIKDLHLLTMKPVIYVLNVSEKEVSSQLVVHSSQDNEVVVSAKIEAELASLTPEEEQEYLKTLELETSGLERLVRKAYAKLNLISFLTGGEKEARAWTITRGMKATQAAGVIHTNFEKNFIKAEVVSYDDFVRVGGWQKARELGKVRLEGKEYEMTDGDVVDFKIGA